MGGCCILSSTLAVPWRWIAFAVDYRRLTCAALLLGGIGKFMTQRLYTLMKKGYIVFVCDQIVRTERGCKVQTAGPVPSLGKTRT